MIQKILKVPASSFGDYNVDSIANSCRLIDAPPVSPPTLPSFRTTRWQKIIPDMNVKAPLDKHSEELLYFLIEPCMRVEQGQIVRHMLFENESHDDDHVLTVL